MEPGSGEWRRAAGGVELGLDPLRYRTAAVAEEIFRVRISALGHFSARPWSPVLALPVPAARLLSGSVTTARAALTLRGSGGFSLRREGLTVTEASGPAELREVRLADTAIVARAGDELPPGPDRLRLSLRLTLRPDERVFGLGLRGGRGDRRHRRLALWNLDPSAPGVCPALDARYSSHPSLLVQGSGGAWGLFVDAPGYSEFDLGAARPGLLELAVLGGELDLYLFTGPDPAAVCEQLTRLTGRPLLPPLWALGFHQSRWSYPDAATVRAVVRRFRERALPLDAVHLDIDYMRGYRVFTWDRLRFPDPEALTAANREEGVRTVTILDPGLRCERADPYPPAEEGSARGLFLSDARGAEAGGYVWPGRVALPDFAREEVRRWWGERQRAVSDAGVEGIWVDMNEPSLVDRPYDEPECRYHPLPLALQHGDGAGRADEAAVHNLYGAQMARAACEGLAQARAGRRPWVLTRSSFTGTQRFAATWTGDNCSRWEDLTESLPQVLGLGLSGMVHAGADIGGFYGNAHPELFVRWMELGAFYPFMRAHTARGTLPHEPWAFGPEAEEAVRAAIGLRYRLLPYLYTLAHLAHRTGAPLLRPLAYDFPDCPGLFDIDHQAMLGPQLLVAPALAPGMTRRLVELPPGTWYDFWSGAPQRDAVVAPTPWGRPPLFVRAGSILTLGPVRASTADPLGTLTVRFYPGDEAQAEAARWTLIEDDGESPGGPVAETDFGCAWVDGRLELHIGNPHGAWRPPPRRSRIEVFADFPPSRVELNGRRVDWVREGAAVAMEL